MSRSRGTGVAETGRRGLRLFPSRSSCRKHTQTLTVSHFSDRVSDWLGVALWLLFLTHECYPGVLFSFSRLGQFFQVKVKPGSASCHVKSLKRCDFKRTKGLALWRLIPSKPSLIHRNSAHRCGAPARAGRHLRPVRLPRAPPGGQRPPPPASQRGTHAGAEGALACLGLFVFVILLYFDKKKKQ